MIADTFKANYEIIDPNRNMHGFEIFSYDFFIDENFRIYFENVNTFKFNNESTILSRLTAEVLD